MSAFKKQLRTAIFDEFEDQTEIAREKFSQCRIGKYSGFFVNSIYSVQKYEKNGVYLLGIRRHDESVNVSWRDKQKIKNAILGKNGVAIEFFPPEEELTDSANMFWLWYGEDINNVYNRIGGL